MQGFHVMDRDRDEAPEHSNRHRSGYALTCPFPSCSVVQPPAASALQMSPEHRLSLGPLPCDLFNPAPSAWAVLRQSVFSHVLSIEVTKLPPLSVRVCDHSGIVGFRQLPLGCSVPDAGPVGSWLAATSLWAIVLSPREHPTQGFPDPVMTQS